MKIVLISDTHGSFYELKKVAMIEYGADLYLHAGDVGPFNLQDVAPFALVKGIAIIIPLRHYLLKERLIRLMVFY